MVSSTRERAPPGGVRAKEWTSRPRSLNSAAASMPMAPVPITTARSGGAAHGLDPPRAGPARRCAGEGVDLQAPQPKQRRRQHADGARPDHHGPPWLPEEQPALDREDLSDTLLHH